MTLQEFNNLKVGDTVYMRKTKRYGNSYGTEVLEIDRFFKKVKVLLRNDFLSYKYVYKKNIPCFQFVGTVKYQPGDYTYPF